MQFGSSCWRWWSHGEFQKLQVALSTDFSRWPRQHIVLMCRALIQLACKWAFSRHLQIHAPIHTQIHMQMPGIQPGPKASVGAGPGLGPGPGQAQGTQRIEVCTTVHSGFEIEGKPSLTSLLKSTDLGQKHKLLNNVKNVKNVKGRILTQKTALNNF